MAIALQPFPPLSVHENSSDKRWKICSLEWMSKMTRENVHYYFTLQEEVSEIFKTLIDTGNDYATAKQKLLDNLLQRRTLNLKYISFDRLSKSNLKQLTHFKLG